MFRGNIAHGPAGFSNWSMSPDQGRRLGYRAGGGRWFGMEKTGGSDHFARVGSRRRMTSSPLWPYWCDLHGARGQKRSIAHRVALEMQGPQHEES